MTNDDQRFLDVVSVLVACLLRIADKYQAHRVHPRY